MSFNKCMIFLNTIQRASRSLAKKCFMWVHSSSLKPTPPSLRIVCACEMYWAVVEGKNLGVQFTWP